jgi:hypothetical protein
MILLLKYVYQKINFLLLRICARTILMLVKNILIMSPIKIALMNDTGSKIDGVGAQLQRLMSIVALCNYLKIPFVQQDFMDVSVHPLDPFQNSIGKSHFINKMNMLFSFNGDTIKDVEDCEVIEISDLSPIKFLKVTLAGATQNRKIIVKVTEPYKITNYYRNLCLDLNCYFPNWIVFVRNFEKQVSSSDIYLHYRQGVGGLVVYPGQKISREMSVNYYLSKIAQIRLGQPNLRKVFIFTDAPRKNLEYIPETDQKSHWEGSPGYMLGKLHVQGNDLGVSFSSSGLDIEVVIGGDPLEAIAVMSLASHLITSRSSLSYVAGLLNPLGKIYFANGFWHPRPSNWN